MNLKTLWFLARRDLTRNVVVLLLVTLAVGSGALVIIPLNGMLNGFIESFYATTIDVSTGHISVVPAKGSRYIHDAETVRKKVASVPGVKAVSARLTDKVFVSAGDRIEPAMVVGVDPADDAEVVTLPERISRGAYLDAADAGRALLGKDLASALDLRVGEKVNIILASGKRVPFSVGGIYSTGFQQLDKQVFIQRSELERLGSLRDEASEIVVRLSSIDKTDSVKRTISALGIEGKVDTWRDRIGFVERLRRNFNIIRGFVVLLTVVASCLTTAVLMYVNVEHKVRFIGVLKAIGTSESGILQLFLLEGLIIGVIGTVVGETLGGLLTWYFSSHPLRATLGVMQGSATDMPIKAVFSFSFLALPALIILPTVVLASLYPAWRAARTAIVEAVWRG